MLISTGSACFVDVEGARSHSGLTTVENIWIGIAASPVTIFGALLGVPLACFCIFGVCSQTHHSSSGSKCNYGSISSDKETTFANDIQIICCCCNELFVSCILCAYIYSYLCI